MVQVFAVNASNDIFTVGGTLQIVRDQAALSQFSCHAVKAQLGEMQYASDRGTNTFFSLWNGSPNLLSFEASVRQQINAIPQVTSIEAFSASVLADKVSYQMTIRTEFGEAEVLGNIPEGFVGG